MKNKPLLIIALIFFICINTSYYWEHYLGLWGLLLMLLLLITFLALSGILLYQLVLLIKSKLTDRSRIYVCIVLSGVLVSTALFPGGIIDYEKLKGEDWMVASIESTANCGSVFRFKTNKKVTERTVCFSVNRTEGTYTISNDTIYLAYPAKDKDHYLYGVIKTDTADYHIPKRKVLMMYKEKFNGLSVPHTITVWNGEKVANAKSY